MRKIFLLPLALVALSLSACQNSNLVKDLASDPATVSVRQTFNGFGVQETIEYVRGNSTGTQAATGTNGTGINIPATSTQTNPVTTIGGTTSK